MRTHRSDLVSLVMGVIFVVLGLRFVQPGAVVWNVDWSWLWPAALLLGGLLVLASARSRGRNPEPVIEDPPSQEPAGPVAP